MTLTPSVFQRDSGGERGVGERVHTEQRAQEGRRKAVRAQHSRATQEEHTPQLDHLK